MFKEGDEVIFLHHANHFTEDERSCGLYPGAILTVVIDQCEDILTTVKSLDGDRDSITVFTNQLKLKKIADFENKVDKLLEE